MQVPQLEGRDLARIPDVCVVTTQQWQQMRTRTAAIGLNEPPPQLVVEVVSTNWRDDYLKKLADYEALGIPEYWIVEDTALDGFPSLKQVSVEDTALGASRYIGTPKQPTISVYQLVADEYQMLFRGGEQIVSATFPELVLTAAQVFAR